MHIQSAGPGTSARQDEADINTERHATRNWQNRACSAESKTKAQVKKSSAENMPGASTDLINRSAETIEGIAATNSWPDLKNEYNEHPLMAACREGKKAIVSELLNDSPELINTFFNSGKNKKQATLLSLVAQEGHDEIARLLLANNADVNTADKFGWTPLHEAADKGHGAMAQLLLNNDADVNTEDKSGRTPLYLAAVRGHLEITQLLLDKNAKVNAACKEHLTPLHKAVMEGHINIVQLLLKKEADVNAADQCGWTPLHRAALEGNVKLTDTLLSYGAKYTRTKPSGFLSRLSYQSVTPIYIAKQGKKFHGTQKYDETIDLLKAAKERIQLAKEKEPVETDKQKHAPLSGQINLCDSKTPTPDMGSIPGPSSTPLPQPDPDTPTGV